MFQPHAVERGREEMEGGGTQQHIVVSKARRGEEREESDVGVLVLCGLPPSLPPERDRNGRRVSERESWEKWAPPRQLHSRAGENVQQCNVVLLVRCMTDEDGYVWREGRPVV